MLLCAAAAAKATTDGLASTLKASSTWALVPLALHTSLRLFFVINPSLPSRVSFFLSLHPPTPASWPAQLVSALALRALRITCLHYASLSAP